MVYAHVIGRDRDEPVSYLWRNLNHSRSSKSVCSSPIFPNLLLVTIIELLSRIERDFSVLSDFSMRIWAYTINKLISRGRCLRMLSDALLYVAEKLWFFCSTESSLASIQGTFYLFLIRAYVKLYVWSEERSLPASSHIHVWVRIYCDEVDMCMFRTFQKTS